MDMHDDVGREAEALVRRYHLLAALEGRTDLRGAPCNPLLAAEMHRQLVVGVDLAFSYADAGWPIRAGVRLERLIYSPWLHQTSLPSRAFRLPQTAAEFADQFGSRTGIGPADADQFQRVYRVTPLALGDVAMRVRDIEPEPWPTFRLLLSHHFQLIDPRVMPAVLAQPPRSAKWFNRPALDGFKLLAEIEREALIGMDLARLARAGTLPQIRDLLANASERHMRERLRTSPSLRRLLSYALVQTRVLGAFDEAARLDGAGAAPEPTSWLTAAAQGDYNQHVGDVAAMLGEKGSMLRELLLEAFATAPAERMNPLNNAAATFWGYDNLMLSRIARAMLGAEYRGGARGVPGGGAYDVHEDRSALAQLILRHVDWVTADTIEQRSKRQQISRSGSASDSLANIQKQAGGHAKYMLPNAGKLGSAPRFSAALWQDRYADRHFWRMVLGKDRRLFVQLNLSHADAAALNNALKRVRELFSPVLGHAGDIEAAISVICDLATAVSSISTDRAFGTALRELLDLLSSFGVERPVDFRNAAHRLAPGSEAFLKLRHRRGQPSADSEKRQGTPRAERHDTRRMKDAASRASEGAAASTEDQDRPGGPETT